MKIKEKIRREKKIWKKIRRRKIMGKRNKHISIWMSLKRFMMKNNKIHTKYKNKR